MTPLSLLFTRTTVVAAVALLIPSTLAGAAGLVLARDGQSDYRIVIPVGATKTEKKAAAELQKYVQEVSGAVMPISSDDEPAGPKEILLGDSRHLRELKHAAIDLTKLGAEGFAIETTGDHLVIAGGPNSGTLYGVYTFLEDYLGCRWFTSKVSHIPKKKTILLGSIQTVQVPAFSFREVFYRDLMNPEFARHLKLNGNSNLEPDEQTWGLWCHSLYALVPPEKYFKEHPEYFSLVNGKRTSKFHYDVVELDAQLCFSQPEVERIAAESLRERMRNRPHAQYWSVSQMDCPVFCECEQCFALNEREGSPMGSTLEFLNRLAARFPDKTLSTLAYTFTIKPPKNIRPASNVCIVVTTTSTTHERPIAESVDSGRDWPDGNNARFRRYLDEWSARAPQFIIWDYVISFGHLLAPFPNLRVLQPNLKLFLASKAQGVFAQGNREVGGELCELRAYLLAKLLWNPDANVEAIMDDFLSGYYGAAALPIRRYIDLLHDAIAKSDVCLTGQDSLNRHGRTFLAPELLQQYQACFDEAEQLVAQEPHLLQRVQTARIPVLYAQLELKYGSVATRLVLAEKLYQYAEQAGIRMISEVDLSSEKYKARLVEGLAKERQDALVASRQPTHTPSRHMLALPSSSRATEVTLSSTRLVALVPPGEEQSAHWRCPRLQKWSRGDLMITPREVSDETDASNAAPPCFVSSDSGVNWRVGDTQSFRVGVPAGPVVRFQDGECFGIQPVTPVLFSKFENLMSPVGDVAVYGNVKFYDPAGLRQTFSELSIVRYDLQTRDWRPEKAVLDVPTMLLLRRNEWLPRPWIESRPLVTRDGKVLVADSHIPIRLADGSVPKQPPVVLFSSEDRSRSWQSEGVVAHDPHRVFTQATLGTTPAGGLLCLLRVNKDDKPGPLFVTRRPANSRTWSALEVFEPDGTWPTLLTLPNGVTAFILSRGSELWLRLSEDPDCRVWSDPIKLTGGDNEPISGSILRRPQSPFASAELLDSDRFLVAYVDSYQNRTEEATRKAILVREVTVKASEIVPASRETSLQQK